MVRRRLFVPLALLAALLALPASASAVLSGVNNGRIVFVSGRTGADGNDTQAKIHLLPSRAARAAAPWALPST